MSRVESPLQTFEPAGSAANGVTMPPVAHKTRRRRLLLALGGLALVAALAAALWVFVLSGNSESVDTALDRDGTAVLVSSDELADVSDELDAPIYWSGKPGAGTKLELTNSADGTFVRYLPPGVPVGASGAGFPTVATYSYANAYEAAQAAKSRTGSRSTDIGGGGIAVTSSQVPNSYYIAYPDSSQLVEVYAATPSEARQLALSGRIAPVE